MRPPRIYKEDTVYHITTHAIGRELLFQDDSDYTEFLEILKTRKEKYDFRLYAYCLVSQHYYFLIEPQPGSASISKIMQAINTSYSLYFNKKYRRMGHLIAGRFESKLFNKDASLLEQSIAIHMTPLQLKATTKLEDYKWSSYLEYTDTQRQEFLTDKDYILSFIDTSTALECHSEQGRTINAADKVAQMTTYKELLQKRAQEVMAQVKESEQTLEVSPAESKRFLSFVSYKFAYLMLVVALIGGSIILPHFLGRKIGKPNLELSFIKENAVNLPEGLPFYTAKTQDKQVWELWKLGPMSKSGEINDIAQ